MLGHQCWVTGYYQVTRIWELCNLVGPRALPSEMRDLTELGVGVFLVCSISLR